MHEIDPTARMVPLLQRFVAAADEEHLGRAAELLDIPPSTLSRSLSLLQTDLGVTLFTPVGRRLRLTSVGRELLVSTRPALTEISTALNRISGQVHPSTGIVRLSFLRTLGAAQLPGIISGYQTIHPQVRFALHDASTAEMTEQLLSGETDLCILSPTPTRPDLAHVTLGSQVIELVVPTGHPLSARANVSLSEIARERLVLLQPGYGTRVTVDSMFAAAGIAPNIVVETNDVAMATRMVESGIGLALLPAVPTLRKVAKVTIVGVATRREIALAWSKSRPLPPPAEAFRDYLRQQLYRDGSYGT